jgi:hypothetical protein
MPKRLPGSREEDSWLSERQLAGLARADQADELGSPVPTQVVSNGEYFPLPQTLQQRQVEVRIAELAGQAGRRLGMSRRRFLASSGGMAAAFLAMNEVFGRFFDVNPLELMGCRKAPVPRLPPPASTRTRSTPRGCPMSWGVPGARGTRHSARRRSPARTSIW